MRSHREYLRGRDISLNYEVKPEVRGRKNIDSSKEAIKIIDLQEKLADKLPIIIEKSTNKPFRINKYLAIVLHQEMGINEDAYTSFIPKIIAKQAKNYHFVIDKEGVIFQLNPVERAVDHCKYKKYSKRASEYFGENYCPIFEDTEKTPHDALISPNLCTLAICLPRIDEEGNIGNEAYTSLIKLCAYFINCYEPALQAQANIICNYYIPENKEGNKDPLCFYSENDYSKLTKEEIADLIKKFDEEGKAQTNDARYLRFRYEVERLRGSWYIRFRKRDRKRGIVIRGYPDIIYQTIEE